MKLIQLALLLLLATAAQADDACSGHGTVDERGLCVCDTPWPSASETGWVGEACQVPVYPGSTDGTDMAAPCTSSQSCSHLDEDGWVCFALTAAAAAGAAAPPHVALLLNRTAGGGDADLYGFLKDTEQPPSFKEAAGFTFQDTATARAVPVSYELSPVPSGDFYACVHNYPGTGDLNFSLQATADACPVSFDAAGAPLVCSTPRDAPAEARRYSECSPAGECICIAPWAKPVPSVLPGLGFESCAAETTMLTPDDIGDDRAYEASRVLVGPQGWRFWGFNTSADDYEVVISVAELGGARVAPFARFGQPPGAGAGQFDERSAWNPSSSERQHRLVLDSKNAGTRTGRWFVGVYGAGASGPFDLSIQKFSCPGNCSSNGVCDAASHQCTCAEGYGGADCSLFSAPLTWDAKIDRSAASALFEYEYFNMPEVTEDMLNGNVEVILTAETSSNAWNVHVQARPQLLVRLDPLHPGAHPQADNFTQRVVLDLDRPHTLTLCASQLVQGPWKVALNNPLPSTPLNYTLAVQKIGRCLNSCSGNGECSEDGVCACSEGWLGGDCSVDAGGCGGGGGGGGGGAKPPHRHPFRSFLGTLFMMAIGAAAALAYVAYRGVPGWLPIMSPQFPNIGLYQELTEAEGL